MKLISIVGNCNACEVSMKQVLADFMDRYEIEEFTISQDLIDKYQLEKTPALILEDEGQVLGKVYGYQPSFILEQWLSAKERGK
ncbi:MAG: thioredoxin family protein [Erysipelotrichaceae bacterium]|nr:thioredoxin family protein [Erysipelotrichaceae bacterium]